MANKSYDNTNTATLWANAGHLENEKQPILRGIVNVDGVEKKVSFWLNGFHSEDEDLNADIADIVAELLEVIAEGGESSPIMRGKLEEPDAGKGGGSKRAPRSSRRSRGAKPAAGERNSGEEGGDNW